MKRRAFLTALTGASAAAAAAPKLLSAAFSPKPRCRCWLCVLNEQYLRGHCRDYAGFFASGPKVGETLYLRKPQRFVIPS